MLLSDECIFPVTSQTTLPFSGFYFPNLFFKKKKKTVKYWSSAKSDDIVAICCLPNVLPISAVLVTAHSLAFIGIQSRNCKCSARCVNVAVRHKQEPLPAFRYMTDKTVLWVRDWARVRALPVLHEPCGWSVENFPGIHEPCLWLKTSRRAE